MATELMMLAWAVLLGVVHVLAAAAAVTRERGLAWNASARDQAPAPLGRIAGRLRRAQDNFLETFPFFAAAAIAVVVAGRSDAGTALAAQAYVVARVVYLPLYVAGVPYLRSLAWVASLVAVLALVASLL